MILAALTTLVLAQTSVQEQTIDGVPVIVLREDATQTEVSIVPSVGNIAYSMKVKGKEVLWSPYKSPAELKAKPQLSGIPFLAPWANRIEGMSYWVNGSEYKLNSALGNLRPDGNKNPIHGLVMFSDKWPTQPSKDHRGATGELKLFQDSKVMAQFPFAHEVAMSYRLQNGILEIETLIHNLSSDPMPVAIGYHPYFQLPGGRDAWTVHIPAWEHVELSPTLIPTGKRTKTSGPFDLPLKGNKLDDVYTSLARNADGNAEFWVTNGKEKLTFSFGTKYQVGVVYAPPGRDFVCFEPMAAITDGFNQNHKGQYPELQMIPPGKTWREVWSIQPSGF